MRNDSFPHPVSDPQAEGLPEHADDDSTAWDDVESGRVADGPEPAALPSDVPLAVDRYGTTAEEQRLGESLEYKLEQEQPDSTLNAEPLAERASGPLDEPAAASVEASVPGALDDPNWNAPLASPVGRIVEPDEGVRTDREKEMFARDAGAAGGGASAEELAMHEEPPPDSASPYPGAPDPGSNAADPR